MEVKSQVALSNYNTSSLDALLDVVSHKTHSRNPSKSFTLGPRRVIISQLANVGHAEAEVLASAIRVFGRGVFAVCKPFSFAAPLSAT